MKPNQQEKCAHKKNLGESCSQCNEAWNDMTSPHQEGWAERFVRSFCDDHGTDDKYKYFDGATIPRDIIAFIRQELTTLHKADCERFEKEKQQWFESATSIFNTVHCKNCQKKAKRMLTALEKFISGGT